MIEVKESIYNNLQLNKYEIVVPKWGAKSAITLGQFIDAIFEYSSGPAAIKALGRSEQTFNRTIKKLFPNVSLHGGGQTWKHWLVSQSDYQWCPYCNSYKFKEEFGSYTRCRPCNRLHSVNNRDGIKQATPKWADLNKIAIIYADCPPGYHVDHEVPINGDNVCGLHVENNLQYLTTVANLQKSNKWACGEMVARASFRN